MDELHPMNRLTYVEEVLREFCSMRATTSRTTRCDRLFAHRLFAADVPLAAVKAAFLVESVRRVLRPPRRFPPRPIRSLSYFGPIIDQILLHPPDLAALNYLVFNLNRLDDVIRDNTQPWIR